MKNVIITLILIISPTTLLAEDNWYLGVGIGSNYSENDLGDPGIYPNLSSQYHVTDATLNFYLTHASNLDLTYKIGYRQRAIYPQGGTPINPQPGDSPGDAPDHHLLLTAILYNITNSSTGWFVDFEAAIITPLEQFEHIEGGVTLSGQKDPGVQLGFGAGKTFSHSWTLRMATWITTSSTIYGNSTDLTTNDQLNLGAEFIYSW